MKNLILGGLVFFFTIILLWYLIYFQLFYIETKFKTKLEGLENISINLQNITGLTLNNVKDIQSILKNSSDTDVIISQLQSLELLGNLNTILNDEQNDSYKILQAFMTEYRVQADALYGKNLLIYYSCNAVSAGNIILNESSINNDKNNGVGVPATNPIIIDSNEPPGIKTASIDFNTQTSIRIPSVTFDQDGKFSGFTAAFWFKPKKVTTGDDNGGCIFDLSNTSETNYAADNIAVLSVNNIIALRVLSNKEQTGINANIDKNAVQEWGHYVCTISKSGSMAIYLNGTIVTRSDKQYDIVPAVGPRTQSLIGKSLTWGYKPLNGYLSDFRVYDTEWKDDDVKNYYDYVNFKLTMNMTNYIINFHLDGKDTNSITNDSTGLLVWKDTVWKGTTNGIASDTKVVYHTTSQKVTVPSGSYIDIPTNNNNFGGPFTIYIVANVYDFNPTNVKGTGNIAYNHLFGSSESNAFQVFFYQNKFCLNLVNIGGGTPTNFPNMPEIDPKIPHVFTITCNSKGSLSFYIDSRPIVKKQTLSNKQIPGNYSIRLACALSTKEYPSSNDLDYYEITHFHNYHNGYSRNMFEGLFAEKWSLRSQLDDSNIFKNLPIQ
jgi:hypothetical protein